MNYPDGQPVKIGDLVWWDGGHYVGFVNSINPPDDCTNSNFVVIGRHPFRRDYPGYALGETRFAEIEFSDEGIGLLTETERAELGRAERIALQTTETPLIYRYTISTEVADHKLQAWIFHFDGPCPPVRVPNSAG